MRESALKTVRVLVELVVTVVLVGLIVVAAQLTRRWQVAEDRQQQQQEYVRKQVIIKDIANTERSYTKSEVAEIITTYGDEFDYIVDSFDEDGSPYTTTQNYIIRDSNDHEAAKYVAINLLNEGKLQSSFESDGDRREYIDDYMWSSDYLMQNICVLGNVNDGYNYKVVIQVPDPTDPDTWNSYTTGDTEATPDYLANKVFRIYYTVDV